MMSVFCLDGQLARAHACSEWIRPNPFPGEQGTERQEQGGKPRSGVGLAKKGTETGTGQSFKQQMSREPERLVSNLLTP